jgi:hypothetical protein
MLIFMHLHPLLFSRIYFRYFPLSFPNDLKKNPLKTIIAARAEAAMVCSCGIRITNAITNVIAAATAPNGIHTLTALEDLSSDDSMLNPQF